MPTNSEKCDHGVVFDQEAAAKILANWTPTDDVSFILLDEIGVPRCSSSCHWVGLDRRRMSEAQKKAVNGRPSWVRERKD